jgi:hypothetical protein
MELEKLVVIQPYQPSNQSGERQWATVEVVLSDCEGVGVRYSGLQVEYAELSPFAGTYEDQSKHSQVDGSRETLSRPCVRIIASNSV